jgi:hypothetical protein
VVFGAGPNTGVFVYSGIPANGNLMASIAALPGTDPYGNAYLAGIVAYNTSTGSSVQVQGGEIFFNITGDQPASAGITPASVFAGVDAIQLSSPLINLSDIQAVLLLIRAASGGTPLVQLPSTALNLQGALAPAAPASGTDLYVDAAGKLVQLPQAGTPMQVPGAQLATFPVITVTQATPTTISGAASVPANDAEVGSVYELEINGNGTWGSTAQNLTFAVVLGGSTMASVNISSTFFNVNDIFRWKIRARVICHTTGVSGTWSSEIDGAVSGFNANLVPGAGVINDTAGVISCEAATTTTLSTQSAQPLALRANWASVTGTPSLTSRVQMFKRVA